MFRNLPVKDDTLSIDPLTGEHKNVNVLDYQGSFPVISLTFGGNIGGNNKGLQENFQWMINPAFYEHSYLLKSEKKGQIDYIKLLKK